jgi:Family of unknown function (DUF6225)
VADDEQLFTHTVRAWTAGELRKALEGVPADWPVIVQTAEEPGGDLLAPEQVVISAAPWNRIPDEPPDHFEIGCEFPSGEYYRRKQ